MLVLTTIDRGIARGSQSLIYTELAETSEGDKVRIVIQSDSYRFQSFAKVERWDGSEWKRVWQIEPGNMQTEPGLVYKRQSGVYDFTADRDALAAFAIKVLG